MKQHNAGSFRDPSGFVFTSDNIILRQINKSYQEEYELLINSGLYEKLIEEKLLIPHQEMPLTLAMKPEIAYKIIKPEQIRFISYPYEWSFSQLRDAALAVLKIQKTALEFGMSLKDAPAYNIQFHRGHPVLIDTLSFEKYAEGLPWVAYKQFSQHFLAPLALMCKVDIRLSQLLKNYIDGIPLDLAAELLPSRTKFSFSFLTHIHMHAKSQKHFSDKPEKALKGKMSKQSLLGLVDSLESSVNKLSFNPGGSEWGNYYNETNYSTKAFEHKKEIIKKFLERSGGDMIWDMGANNGEFSRLANTDSQVIAFDIDPVAVEKNYLNLIEQKIDNILPLQIDLTNPSPALGWNNKERQSLSQRGPADTVMALALVHHLAISNNLPLAMIARFFERITKNYLIIEFIPKVDSQVQKLLASRVDIFSEYTQESFEAAFSQLFTIVEKTAIVDSSRLVYLLQSKANQ